MTDQQQDLIRRACGHVSGWQDCWAALAERGATDEQIVAHLNKKFRIFMIWSCEANNPLP